MSLPLFVPPSAPVFAAPKMVRRQACVKGGTAPPSAPVSPPVREAEGIKTSVGKLVLEFDSEIRLKVLMEMASPRSVRRGGIEKRTRRKENLEHMGQPCFGKGIRARQVGRGEWAGSQGGGRNVALLSWMAGTRWALCRSAWWPWASLWPCLS